MVLLKFKQVFSATTDKKNKQKQKETTVECTLFTATAQQSERLLLRNSHA